jgi:hypothetical protein
MVSAVAFKVNRFIRRRKNFKKKNFLMWKKFKSFALVVGKFLVLFRFVRQEKALKVIQKEFTPAYKIWRNVAKSAKLFILVTFCETSLTRLIIEGLMTKWRFKVLVNRSFSFKGLFENAWPEESIS